MTKKSTTPQAKLAQLVARVPQDRAEMLQHILSYAQTDLLCYRAPPDCIPGLSRDLLKSGKHVGDPGMRRDDSLRQKQDALFTPILEWLMGQGMVFHVTDAIMPIAQPRQSIEKLGLQYEKANDQELAALSLMVPLLGSALLALAIWKKQISVEQALRAARLDEDFQAECWGEDEQAANAWAIKAEDIRAAAFFLDN